jgi:hypothetical protein
LRIYKPVRPPVPEDAVGRATWRIAVEKEKEKKDAKKDRAHERMRAWDALEKLRQRQARDGLSREPSLETPDDDDDDDDDEMMRTMTWQPDLASARTRGWARGRQASLLVGWRH